MTVIKSTLAASLLAASVAAGALAAFATPAAADVACNRYGECWRVKEHYTTYPANLGVTFHDDAWREHHGKGHHWRKDRDDDRGYYAHGRWHSFEH